MTRLLCLLGLHHPEFRPHLRESREQWLQIRTCTRCGQPLPRYRR